MFAIPREYTVGVMHKYCARIVLFVSWLALAGTALASPFQPVLGQSMPGGPEFLILFLLIGVGGSIVWIMALVDLLKNTRLEGTDKIVWLLVVILLQLVGAIIYYVMAPRSARKSS